MANYVNGLTIAHFKIKWDSTINQAYFTNGIEVNNFKRLKIFDFDGKGAPHNKNAYRILLANGDGVTSDSKYGMEHRNVTNMVVNQN